MVALSTVLAAVLLAGPQDRPGTMGSFLGGVVFGGYLESGGERLTYGASVTPFVGEHIALEFEVARTPDVFLRAQDSTLSTFTASLFVTTHPRSRVSGHLAFGVGGARSNLYVRNHGPQDTWHPIAAAGVGATIDFTRRFGGRVDLKYLFALDDADRLAEFDRQFGDLELGRATVGLFVWF